MYLLLLQTAANRNYTGRILFKDCNLVYLFVICQCILPFCHKVPALIVQQNSRLFFQEFKALDL